MSQNASAWAMTLERLEKAAKIAELDPEVTALLREPQRIFVVSFPVRMDDGTTRLFKGYRVHHNHALGPIMGGTRFHGEETLDDVKALGLLMTLKNSLNGLSAGGGKGGVVVDPDSLSKTELERLCRAYIRAIAPMVGTWLDFPGADLGTDSQTQSWFLDELEQMNAMTHNPAAISGKDIILGGSQGRAAATGLGVMFSVREACRILGIQLKGLRIAIQGVGKVGGWAASLLYEKGAKIVAVSDVFGGVCAPGGINVPELLKFVEKTGKVEGFFGAKAINKNELLTVDCDVIIPAAVQNVINTKVASNIKAKVVAEGANGPTTPDGEEVLLSRGIFVVPDILANGGGTTVAYLEKVQNLYECYWSEKEVHAKYEEMFVQCFNEIYKICKEKGISMRMASYVKALKRIELAIKVRGWV
ncbi:NAD-specific glutamate dehydrogenase [Pelotomaculum schinkii]|uniref:Glutamate dehydrogenase n=1 Tax=Pelotomaculum schinkii TaxID=78350 RepID=A0A4Y7R6T6_9FIRM|nr:Glu/Leu/Phe/Val dehydrogenase [Pelotomaculum schinkii]TEB04439.1 NAD-specific glutamate dehydrogenase [Pelotomaculum schinkii]